MYTGRRNRDKHLQYTKFRIVHVLNPNCLDILFKALQKKGDIAYDPFSGRGTTGILERDVILNDVNPLSTILAKPKFELLEISEICKKLLNIDFSKKSRADIDLSMFYHKETESELVNLKLYLEKRRSNAEEDETDR